MEDRSPFNAEEALLRDKVNAFRTSHAKYFNPEDMQSLVRELLNTDMATVERVGKLSYKNATVARLLAIFPFTGFLGIDRFYAGGKRNLIIGVIKLVTMGGAGILWLIDATTMGTNVRTENYCRAFGIERSLKDSATAIEKNALSYVRSEEGKQQLGKLKDGIKQLHDEVTHDI